MWGEMGKVVKGLFGGGSSDAERQAKEAAERSKQAQAVANDRQLAELNRQDQENTITRRQPRGRRLFEDGPASASTSLGNA